MLEARGPPPACCRHLADRTVWVAWRKTELPAGCRKHVAISGTWPSGGWASAAARVLAEGVSRRPIERLSFRNVRFHAPRADDYARADSATGQCWKSIAGRRRRSLRARSWGY